MEAYEKSYDEKVRFLRAELYECKGMKLPKEFYDSTGGPFNMVPFGSWLMLYNQNGTMGQCPCSERMKRLVKQVVNGETKTYREWYEMLHWNIRNDGFSGEMALELGRLDHVFYDMMAKEAGLPLHKFLGATRDWVEVYASGCGTNLTFEEMEKEVASFIDAGYTTFKMKIATDFGTKLDRDIERVKIVRDMIGPKAKLALDANQLWKADEALDFAKRVEQFDIAWFEEPVHSYDMLELEKLAKVSPIPLAMGESPRCYYPLESYVKAGVAQLQPIPSNLSSVEEWLRARKLAYDHNLEFTSGGYSHMTAAFIASGREEDMVEYLIPVMQPMCEFMEVCPEEKDGKFYLPDVPGHCLVPDIKKLEQYNLFVSKEYY